MHANGSTNASAVVLSSSQRKATVVFTVLTVMFRAHQYSKTSPVVKSQNN